MTRGGQTRVRNSRAVSVALFGLWLALLAAVVVVLMGGTP